MITIIDSSNYHICLVGDVGFSVKDRGIHIESDQLPMRAFNVQYRTKEEALDTYREAVRTLASGGNVIRFEV